MISHKSELYFPIPKKEILEAIVLFLWIGNVLPRISTNEGSDKCVRAKCFSTQKRICLGCFYNTISRILPFFFLSLLIFNEDTLFRSQIFCLKSDTKSEILK